MIRVSAIGCVLCALLLAACGGSSSSGKSSASSTASTPPATTTSAAATSSSSGSGSGKALQLAADPSGQLKFDKSSVSASAGNVTIAFTNNAQLGHNLTVASSSGAVVGATPTFEGGSKTLSLKLKPGTYTFYCSVPGHRQAGMQGTLVVR
jgi:plastocyanin